MPTANWVAEQAAKYAKDEDRRFAIAYAELDEKYHGFMQEYPSNVRICKNDGDHALSQDDQKKLERDFPQLQFYGKAVWYKFRTPYLGVDGCIAILNDTLRDEDQMSIDIETLQIPNCPIAYTYWDESKGKSVNGMYTGERTLIVAKVKVNNKVTTGIAEVEFDPKTQGFGSVEIASSSAVRKAIGYQGHGRFGIHQTSFGDDPLIVKFREFVIKEREKNEGATSK